ncbi:12279_t:CDS:1 [Funneliformis geosporum]|uniref:19827_t:CDS:1 n=1 Tax=Funneliformis geosporum TaxID=1117311 RepID=A0A9W4WQ25_9GLOM|nr:12279_t:CDS:1 [Funneliformis geosporum]CAI2163443.1 19827_t:CDS:1 [Funneliformis geosporum]
MTNCNSSPKPYDIKVPRPPNAFIIYHRNKSKELAKSKSIGKCESYERHPSKTVAEMWKEEPEAIKLRYQREADLALVEHKKKYPFYKYKPKKRESKNKTKSQSNSKEVIKDLNNDHKRNETVIKGDSEVPMQHRKQAAMESAFTAFDMQSCSSSSHEEENSADNISVSNHSPPHTPTSPNSVNMPHSRAPASLWIEPITNKQFFNEHLNFSPSQQTNHRCQCTAHCVNNNDVMTSLGILSPEQAAFSIIFNNVYKQTVDQFVNTYGFISQHPNSATIADDLVTSPYPTTTCDMNETTYFPPQNWTYTANYVVPSQSPTSSSSSNVVPSPTSTGYMPWITYGQSMNSQFIDPIQNIPNIVPNETNCNLFTDTNNEDCALFDNFDANLNFSL